MIRAIQCFQQTGYVYWKDWRLENWGTKWNAYGVDMSNIDQGELRFDTAWNMPLKIAEKLSTNNPDVEIVWIYADEDIGSNCGTLTLLNGQAVNKDCAGRWSEMTEDEQSKWREFAYKIKYPNEDFQEYLKEIEEDA